MFTSGQTNSCYDCVSPPDWRWRQACRTYSRGRPYRKKLDDPEWLRPLIVLVKVASGRPPPKTPLPPELRQAFSYFQSSGPPGWELEVPILAGQSDAEIAAAMDIPPAVVGAYEEFFFSVRDRLDAADFILSTLIGYTPFRGFDQGDLRGLWVYFAYTAGPKMLEIAMAVSRGRPLPDWAMCVRAGGGGAGVRRQGDVVGLYRHHDVPQAPRWARLGGNGKRRPARHRRRSVTTPAVRRKKGTPPLLRH